LPFCAKIRCFREAVLIMRQLLLNLEAAPSHSLDTFVTGRNAEVAGLIDTIMQAHSSGQILALDQRFIYLWGHAGAGKSHLLHALADVAGVRYLDGAVLTTDAGIDDAFRFDAAVRLYLIDDCDRLSPAAQIAAFALFNQVRENGAVLIATGALPPAQLSVREDLRTRLGWGLIYRLHELSDVEKIEALHRAAEGRALVLSAGVLPYLITHFQRDMRSLSAMLDALDRYSLETQRPITLPLLRNLIQQQGEPSA
jgi:DnaA family protein